MKVLLVSQPAADGVFRHVEGLADYLLGKGISVDLAYSDRQACEAFPRLLERIEAAGGRTLNLRVGNSPEPSDLPAVHALLAMIRATKPDLIHAHSSKAGALVRGMALCGLKTPILYTAHAYYRMHAPGGAKARFFHWIERVLARGATTISVSNDESTFARERLGIADRYLRMVPNGVDCDRFRPAADAEQRALRVQFELPPDALVLGTVGRYAAQKDPLTTYRALASVLPSLPNLYFIHLGKGELEPEVDALIAQHGLADRFRRVSYLADTAPFYRVLDGFVLASLYEGLSYAGMEAVATGLPLILSDAPGNRDFGLMGLDRLYWTAPQDPAALAVAIRKWHEVGMRLGPTTVHRDVAVARLSLDAAFGNLIDVYREMAGPVLPSAFAKQT